jgi:hypothetical protein
MNTTTERDDRVFVARPSKTGPGVTIPGVGFLLVLTVLFLFRDSVPAVVVWTAGPLFLVLGAIFVGMGFFFRWAVASMKYVLAGDTLTITGGSVRYDVPVASIERVYRRDVNNRASNTGMFSANAVNTPGLALANVTWRDTGLLKMCATSWKDVVLIETPKNTYGITPVDVDGFLGALSERGVPVGQPEAAQVGAH